MKDLTLKKVTINNFMGIAKGSFDFEQMNNLLSKSGEGKTAIRKAFLWALGQNINNYAPAYKTKEGISKEIILGLEISVMVEFFANGKNYTVERKAKHNTKTDPITMEKKYTGTIASNFTLNEMSYNARQFETELEKILGIEKDILPIFLEIDFFNNTTLTWKDKNRRAFLLKPISYELSKVEQNLLENNKYSFIKEKIEEGKTVEDIASILRVDLNSIRQKLRTNAEIYETYQKDIAELSATDYNAIQSKLQSIEGEKAELLSKQSKDGKTSFVDTIKQQIEKLEKEKENLLYDYNYKVEQNNKNKALLNQQLQSIIYEGRSINNEIEEIKSNNQSIRMKLEVMKIDVKNLELDISDIQSQIKSKEKETFDENDTLCPTCGQKLPEKKINELLEQYQSIKNNSINRLKAQIENVEQEIESKKKKISETEYAMEINEKRLAQKEEKKAEKTKDYKAKKAEINELSMKTLKKPDISELENKIADLEAKRDSQKNESKTDETAVNTMLFEMENEIKKCKEILKGRTNIEFLTQKCKEIISDNKNLADREMKNKQNQAILKEYNKEKMKVAGEVVNSYFHEDITFALYNYQPAAKDDFNEYIETCEVVYKGKVYSNLSMGERVHCNYLLQIGLQKLYNINIPIWIEDYEIDQRPLSETEQQVIIIRNDDKTKLPVVKIADLYIKE